MSVSTQLVPMQSNSSPWSEVWSAPARTLEVPSAEQPDPTDADIALEPMKSNSSPWTELFEDGGDAASEQPTQDEPLTSAPADSRPAGRKTANRATARHD
jgi:hypothetical protein